MSKCESASGHFQPGEGPCRGLLRDCENIAIVCSPTYDHIHMRPARCVTWVDVGVVVAVTTTRQSAKAQAINHTSKELLEAADVLEDRNIGHDSMKNVPQGSTQTEGSIKSIGYLCHGVAPSFQRIFTQVTLWYTTVIGKF